SQVAFMLPEKFLAEQADEQKKMLNPVFLGREVREGPNVVGGRLTSQPLGKRPAGGGRSLVDLAHAALRGNFEWVGQALDQRPPRFVAVEEGSECTVLLARPGGSLDKFVGVAVSLGELD